MAPVGRAPSAPRPADPQGFIDRGSARVRDAFAREGLSPAVVARFRRLVRSCFTRFGREFPWRDTTDPYGILVSEFMLQQTQVERVRPRYGAFLQAFPDIHALARSPLAGVLRIWQGLGYNRRARSLHQSAREISRRHGGVVPAAEEELLSLPGVGPSTAGAVRAFAYGLSAVFIETNIRRVFIHGFFPAGDEVSDREILPLVHRTLDRRDPRRWYYGLMDCGALLAAGRVNPNRRSSHYQRQAPFAGSDRQLRGVLLRALLASGPGRLEELARNTGVDAEKLEPIVGGLVVDGLVRKKNGRYMAG